MRMNWQCNWTIKHVRDGKVIWQFNHDNLLTYEGAKALVDTIFRDNASTYWVDTNFFVGMYHGSVSKTTVLATVPGEPAGNGYARVECERSIIGFPTIEQDELFDWRVVSKEMTFGAVGGNIGPIDGAFICTSSDNSGALIGAVAFGVQRTIISGDSIIATIKAKIK